MSEDDGLGWAWGLQGAVPEQVWERLAPAYEAQLAIMKSNLETRGYTVERAYAGSEDGEVLLAYRGKELHSLFALEDPTEALEVQKAIQEDRLDAYFDAAFTAAGKC